MAQGYIACILIFSLLAALCARAEPLRVWIDEHDYAEGETELLKEALAASQGLASLAGTSHGGFLSPKGWHNITAWDLYWTGRDSCYRALTTHLRPGQLVSCSPGSQAITNKARLISTMRVAYGERGAAAFVPGAFVLPEDYLALARAVVAAGPARPWVLKSEAHRGRGIAIVPGPRALGMALQQRRGAKGDMRPAFVVAQRFVDGQMLVARRPFYVRLWVLSRGTAPARAYLFDGGVVVFGSVQPPRGAGTGAGAGPGDGADEQERRQAAEEARELGMDSMVVNLWRQDREAAQPWALSQLWRHIDAEHGAGAGAAVWRRMRRAVAAAALAASTRTAPARKRSFSMSKGSRLAVPPTTLRAKLGSQLTSTRCGDSASSMRKSMPSTSAFPPW